MTQKCSGFVSIDMLKFLPGVIVYNEKKNKYVTCPQLLHDSEEVIDIKLFICG